ncbi:phospholipase B-like protein [Pelagophyceae sp. CCMP2097]|nr:phospholipase B-like protein [Pelagophyceae sp. CCMP2097]
MDPEAGKAAAAPRKRYVHLAVLISAGAVSAAAVVRAFRLGRNPPIASAGHAAAEREYLATAVELTHCAALRSGTWVVLRDCGPGDAAARATFTPAAAHASGFGELHVRSEPSTTFSDDERMFAAGLLEGYLTAKEVVQTAKNLECEVDCGGQAPPPVSAFLARQRDWAQQRVESHARLYAEGARTPDVLAWRVAGGVSQQLRGVHAGVRLSPLSSTAAAPGQNVTWGIELINSIGDLLDILPATLRSKREDLSKAAPAAASTKLARSGRCTALIKVADDLSELFFGHSSWFHYDNMNRIYKHYSLVFEDAPGATTSFSSYPGMLSSLDDFYLVKETQIAVLQTTNGIYNVSLYDAVTSASLPAWQRMRVANALAETGDEWAAIFGKHNGGTYNNQYMVIDTKRFTPKEALQPGLLTIVEQIPGYVEFGDATFELERGYFPSYNVPYFKDVYRRAGYDTLDKRKGRLGGAEYQLAPRAKILRRDQSTVVDLPSMQKLMRANGYTPNARDKRRDPFAKDGWAAICARGDVDAQNASLAGCYDAKVSSAKLFREHQGAYVVNGPPSSGALRPFKWSAVDTASVSGSASHLGQPDVFDFRYELLAPRWPE